MKRPSIHPIDVVVTFLMIGFSALAASAVYIADIGLSYPVAFVLALAACLTGFGVSAAHEAIATKKRAREIREGRE